MSSKSPRPVTVTAKLRADLMGAAKAKALAKLRQLEPEILHDTRLVVPIDTGSLASTVRLEWNAKGFRWRVGDLQGLTKYVDYAQVVDDRQSFVDGRVAPAIRFVLARANRKLTLN